MRTDEVVLRVPAKSDYVALVRVVLAAAAAIEPDSRDDRIDDLRIAVSEAVTNAVEAHQAAGTDSHIEVRCVTSGNEVEVTVRDRGPGFDPEDVPTVPEPESPERLLFEHGLGLPLMQRLVDHTDIHSDDDGTLVRLVIDTSTAPN
ncbi:MAG: ATP-binding protein [Acidimicrobiales bacterium]